MEEIVDRIAKTLHNVGAKVNKTCGLHVHLDMRNRSREKAFSNLVNSQSMLYAMQPKARRDSRFCRKTKSPVFAQAMREATGENVRYMGINPHAWERHQTIEIRIHSGTTNATKIKNWVKILCGIVNKTEAITTEPRKVEAFAETFNIPNDVVVYMKSRMDKFRDQRVGIENEENGEAA
jgi:hypothetical protein